jgi:hypothetical protein
MTMRKYLTLLAALGAFIAAPPVFARDKMSRTPRPQHLKK